MHNKVFSMFDLIERGTARQWSRPGLNSLGASAPRERYRPAAKAPSPVKRLSRREISALKMAIKTRLDEEALHDELLEWML